MPRLLAAKPQASSNGSATPVGNHYDKKATRHPIERRMVDGFDAALTSVLPIDAKRVLDVGCGEGNHMGEILRNWPDATVAGIDIADAEWLRQWHPPESRVAVADAAALPFGEGTFDLVLALEVLEHVPDPDAVLRQIALVCEGAVILSVPWEPLWRAGNMVRGRYVGEWGNTPGHIQHFTRRGFVRAVNRHFEVETVKTPFPWTLVRAHVR
jgi:2-polyprenyl-3-methyl-5-hydroxy-6-metoxy-1,4-benzoquinol methylase